MAERRHERPKPRPGRPAIVDAAFDQERERFLRFLRHGNTLKDSARAAGISLSSVMHARALGRFATQQARDGRRLAVSTSPRTQARAATLLAEAAALEPYRDFLTATEHAKGDAKAVLVERWHRASRKSWKAAERLLRARYPAEFAPDQMIRLIIAKIEAEVGRRTLPGVHVGREAPDISAIPPAEPMPSSLPALPPPAVEGRRPGEGPAAPGGGGDPRRRR